MVRTRARRVSQLTPSTEKYGKSSESLPHVSVYPTYSHILKVFIIYIITIYDKEYNTLYLLKFHNCCTKSTNSFFHHTIFSQQIFKCLELYQDLHLLVQYMTPYCSHFKSFNSTSLQITFRCIET